MTSFTWGHVKTFFPVYIYWLICLVYLYIFPIFMGFFLNPADSSSGNAIPTRYHYLFMFNDILNFFALLSYLQVPYFLILKQYANSLQAVVYGFFIYWASMYFWEFVDEVYEVMYEAIMCSGSGIGVSFYG